jgi:hypothetical protein
VNDSVATVEQSLAWYDRKAQRARSIFLLAKVTELTAATAIPVAALAGAPSIVLAAMGALIAVVAGSEQLFRFQETWISYRQAAEALRTELFLFRATAGPYDSTSVDGTVDKLIAVRAAAIMSEEVGRWETLARSASIGEQTA